MKKTVSYFLFALFFIPWFLLLRPVFLGGPASYVIVNGASMEPTLHDGDLVVMQRAMDYAPGDIIAYQVPGGNVIHTITGGDGVSGYITQGDNKTDSDPWQPVFKDVLGKLWFRLPGAGRIVIALRQPQSLIALIGMTALFTLDSPRIRKRRSARRETMKANIIHTPNVYTPHPEEPREATRPGRVIRAAIRPAWLAAFLVEAALIILVMTAAAVISFRQPLVKPQVTEVLRYQHAVSFRYAVQTKPSFVYPEGRIGPVEPALQAAPLPALDMPVFTQLARSLDLDFTYAFQSELPADVNGAWTGVVELKMGDGWIKTIPISEARAFTGPSVSSSFSIDYSEIQGIVDTISNETGYFPASYEVSVIPELRVAGKVGETSIDEVFRPVYSFTVDQTQIRLDPELSQTEVKTITEESLISNHFELFGYSIPVRTARWVSAILLILSLGWGFYVYWTAGRGLIANPRFRYRVQYGSLIVDTTAVHLGEVQSIQVTSMKDLVQFTKRDGGVVFHQARSGYIHQYFVPDGNLVYFYSETDPTRKK